MRRISCLVLLALALSGCSGIYLQQNPEDALIRVGEERRFEAAAPYANAFLDYALLADQSYADGVYTSPGTAPVIGRATYCEARPPGGEGCLPGQDYTAYAKARLSAWKLIYARLDFDRDGCPVSRPGCLASTPGLGVQIWVKRGRVCSEAAVVFRGTDGASADDWVSNFRWFLRLLPLYDQYEQVQDETPEFVRALARHPCYDPRRTRVVAVGHSLGGGLAQQMGYKAGEVDRVVAFDPSFVTGFSDLPEREREANARGLQIQRVYEHGEILAYPRFVLRQLFPLSTCDPEIVTVRLNTMEADPLKSHNLSSMTTAFLRWSDGLRRKGRAADKPLPRPTLPACLRKEDRFEPGREITASSLQASVSRPMAR